MQKWYLTILSGAEQVGMARTDGQGSHRGHVSRQRQFQFARRQVPDLRVRQQDELD